MAWKHGRDHHLVKYRTGLPENLLTHQMAHELTHLRLEVEARKVGKNRFFVTTSTTEATAMERVQSDIRKLHRMAYAPEVVQGLIKSLVVGLANFLYNCPLDML